MTTVFNPNKLSEFTSTNLNFRGTGILFTAAANSTTTSDYQMPEDRMITGAQMICESSTFGDYVVCQVVDKDGLYYPAGTVLSQFLSNWYVCTDSQRSEVTQIPYPAKILQGLYVRIMYTSTALLTTHRVAINYYYHKVMI